MESITEYCAKYSSVGDVLTLVTCITFLVLTKVSYIRKTKTFEVFKWIIVLLALSVIFRLFHYQAIKSIDAGAGIPIFVPYVLRYFYNIGILTDLFMFIVYMIEPMQIEINIARNHLRVAFVMPVIAYIYGIVEMLTDYGYNIVKVGGAYFIDNDFRVYQYIYIALIVFLALLLLYYRRRVYKQILIGVFICSFMSVLIIAIQTYNGFVSYTAATFLFPLYAVFYMIHSSPYDIELGTVDSNAFGDYIKSYAARKEGIILIELYNVEIEKTGRKYPEGMRSGLRETVSNYFKRVMMFQISQGRIFVAANYSQNLAYRSSIKDVFKAIDELMDIYKLEYKVVGVVSKVAYDDIKKYTGITKFIGSKIEENTAHLVTPEEEKQYLDREKIIFHLKDIATQKNLNDERVLVYCQPVYNIEEGIYDTAEALIRLKIDDKIIFPNDFIYIAEKYNVVTSLTFIMLHKVCHFIKEKEAEGYNIKRISINFSVMDFRKEYLCRKIIEIVNRSGIDFYKIAIEVTETQNENDFTIMKDKINELRMKGIKFYLDDFGTGYSNYERLMEFPFDIIKFDRSLVIASKENYKSAIMTTDIAKMFKNLKYYVLYEGIENEEDIERCSQMGATYLQGYYYSKPIPIEDMTKFFQKKTGKKE